MTISTVYDSITYELSIILSWDELESMIYTLVLCKLGGSREQFIKAPAHNTGSIISYPVHARFAREQSYRKSNAEFCTRRRMGLRMRFSQLPFTLFSNQRFGPPKTWKAADTKLYLNLKDKQIFSNFSRSLNGCMA